MLHLEFCCRSIHAIHPLDKTLTGIPNKSQNHYDRFKRLSSLMNTQSSPIFIHLKPPLSPSQASHRNRNLREKLKIKKRLGQDKKKGSKSPSLPLLQKNSILLPFSTIFLQTPTRP